MTGSRRREHRRAPHVGGRVPGERPDRLSAGQRGDCGGGIDCALLERHPERPIQPRPFAAHEMTRLIAGLRPGGGQGGARGLCLTVVVQQPCVDRLQAGGGDALGGLGQRRFDRSAAPARVTRPDQRGGSQRGATGSVEVRPVAHLTQCPSRLGAGGRSVPRACCNRATGEREIPRPPGAPLRHDVGHRALCVRDGAAMRVDARGAHRRGDAHPARQARSRGVLACLGGDGERRVQFAAFLVDGHEEEQRVRQAAEGVAVLECRDAGAGVLERVVEAPGRKVEVVAVEHAQRRS